MAVSALMDELEVIQQEPLLPVPVLARDCAFQGRCPHESRCAGSLLTLTERVLSFMERYKYPSV